MRITSIIALLLALLPSVSNAGEPFTVSPLNMAQSFKKDGLPDRRAWLI